jgi:mRNA turnover protein 4
MPKSKRSKVTTLSKTPLRSTKASKSALVTDLQSQIDQYDYVWLFSVGDMRNEGLKEVRGQWRGTGRFYFGKGKVMAKALGETPETEHADGLSQLAKVRTLLCLQCSELTSSD